MEEGMKMQWLNDKGQIMIYNVEKTKDWTTR